MCKHLVLPNNEGSAARRYLPLDITWKNTVQINYSFPSVIISGIRCKQFKIKFQTLKAALQTEVVKCSGIYEHARLQIFGLQLMLATNI